MFYFSFQFLFSIFSPSSLPTLLLPSCNKLCHGSCIYHLEHQHHRIGALCDCS